MTRSNPPHERGGKRRSPGSDSSRHLANDDGPTVHDPADGPTSIDGPKVRDMLADSGRLHDVTNVEGARVETLADPHDTVSSELLLGHGQAHEIDTRFDDEEEDDEWDDDPTVYRGDNPPKPSSSRRWSPTLSKLFTRKREQIGLSLAQLAKLTGIDEEELTRFEGTNGGHRLVYDHAVLVARVLGVKPAEMPGLRSSKATKDAAGAALGSLQTALLAGPVLTFEGKSGERFGGDLERLGSTPHFAIRIGDSSLGESWPKGSLLGFLMDASPAAGDVVLVRSKRTKQLGLRRATGSAWAPLVAWQPAYAVGGEWLATARLQAILPRP